MRLQCKQHNIKWVYQPVVSIKEKERKMTMHYSKLLKITGDTDVSPVHNICSADTNNIMSFLKEIAEKTNVEAPKSVTDTILNDKQINDILDYLWYLQKTYFHEIPLSNKLCQQFIWNIPKEVYKCFCVAKQCKEDVFNPITYLYIFCVDEPQYRVGRFVDIINKKLITPYLSLITKTVADEIDGESDEEDEENE